MISAIGHGKPTALEVVFIEFYAIVSPDAALIILLVVKKIVYQFVLLILVMLLKLPVFVSRFR